MMLKYNIEKRISLKRLQHTVTGGYGGRMGEDECSMIAWSCKPTGRRVTTKRNTGRKILRPET
jgi:hypothetical protein